MQRKLNLTLDTSGRSLVDLLQQPRTRMQFKFVQRGLGPTLQAALRDLADRLDEDERRADDPLHQLRMAP